VEPVAVTLRGRRAPSRNCPPDSTATKVPGRIGETGGDWNDRVSTQKMGDFQRWLRETSQFRCGYDWALPPAGSERLCVERMCSSPTRTLRPGTRHP